MHHGTLADSVVGVVVVNMKGTRVELRDESPELRAARTALGRVGS